MSEPPACLGRPLVWILFQCDLFPRSSFIGCSSGSKNLLPMRYTCSVHTSRESSMSSTLEPRSLTYFLISFRYSFRSPLIVLTSFLIYVRKRSKTLWELPLSIGMISLIGRFCLSFHLCCLWRSGGRFIAISIGCHFHANIRIPMFALLRRWSGVMSPSAQPKVHQTAPSWAQSFDIFSLLLCLPLGSWWGSKFGGNIHSSPEYYLKSSRPLPLGVLTVCTSSGTLPFPNSSHFHQDFWVS